MIVQVEKCTVYQYCLKEPYYFERDKNSESSKLLHKFCAKHGTYCGIAVGLVYIWLGA